MDSPIAQLRLLAPARPLNPGEALRIAELQANRLLAIAGVSEPPVAERVISGLPRIEVARLSPIPVSGSAHWAKGRWVIVLNGAEPLVRQRYSLAHELKHVLDQPLASVLYPASRGQTSEERAEQVADWFAASLLMPRAWVKRAWAREGIQDLRTLAHRFGVSQQAMRVRLLCLGLTEPATRCGGRLTRAA
jgi:Zn-dependent peptidase ImmA (M78 family)